MFYAGIHLFKKIMLEACLDKLKEHLQIVNSGSMNDNMLYPRILKMCSSLQTAIAALPL